MSKLRTLARLVRLRRLEEEKSRQEVESVVVARDRIRSALEQTRSDLQAGRRAFAAGILGARPIDRFDAQLTMQVSRRRQERLEPELEAAERVIEARRTDFLTRRTARRQVETLAEEQRCRDEMQQARRAQQMLDDWYRRRIAMGLVVSSDEPVATIELREIEVRQTEGLPDRGAPGQGVPEPCGVSIHPGKEAASELIMKSS